MKANAMLAGVAALAAAAILASAAGCSTPRDRYNVLSFFFDGVPDPDAVDEADAGGDGADGGASAVTASDHGPYKDGDCAACHPGMRSRKKRSSTSSMFAVSDMSAAWKGCRTCHSGAGAETDGPVVVPKDQPLHGPVAVGECASCHLPHRSDHAYLLRSMTAAPLCITCHEGMAERTGTMAPMDCVVCHDPHQGRGVSGLLRGPASEPACSGCHVPNAAERPWLHGPVAAGLCGTCHDTHGLAGSSGHVRRPLTDVCLRCHEEDTLARESGCTPESECDSCHDPHSAPTSGDVFLRTRIGDATPAFLPSTNSPPVGTEPVPTSDGPEGAGATLPTGPGD